MNGVTALKLGPELQSTCCQFSQLLCELYQEPSEDSSRTPEAVRSGHGGLKTWYGRSLPQWSLTCIITAVWTDFLRLGHSQADEYSLLSVSMGKGCSVTPLIKGPYSGVASTVHTCPRGSTAHKHIGHFPFSPHSQLRHPNTPL